MFALIDDAIIAYVWFSVIEASGRSLEEMDMAFVQTESLPLIKAPNFGVEEQS